ncbi:MAG: hypothetical protein HY320_09770, partial [Armatimonadetes bacterium]|nr:hypothetical protein [Armatimonadota bacterium]
MSRFRRRLLACIAVAALGVLLCPRPVGQSRLPRDPLPPPPAPPALQPPVTAAFAVPVLMYHRIDEPPAGAGPLLRDLTVTPADFERQVRYLVENGYAVLTAGQVERAVRLREPLPARAAALTLDDGYGCAFTRAFPILRRYGLDGT